METRLPPSHRASASAGLEKEVPWGTSSPWPRARTFCICFFWREAILCGATVPILASPYCHLRVRCASPGWGHQADCVSFRIFWGCKETRMKYIVLRQVSEFSIHVHSPLAPGNPPAPPFQPAQGWAAGWAPGPAPGPEPRVVSLFTCWTACLCILCPSIMAVGSGREASSRLSSKPCQLPGLLERHPPTNKPGGDGVWKTVLACLVLRG